LFTGTPPFAVWLQVPDFQGLNVKAADNKICEVLKARGRLYSKSTLVHSYPFCWRSETPLIYKWVPAPATLSACARVSEAVCGEAPAALCAWCEFTTANTDTPSGVPAPPPPRLVIDNPPLVCLCPGCARAGRCPPGS
jgi:hypothetical protein